MMCTEQLEEQDLVEGRSVESVTMECMRGMVSCPVAMLHVRPPR